MLDQKRLIFIAEQKVQQHQKTRKCEAGKAAGMNLRFWFSGCAAITLWNNWETRFKNELVFWFFFLFLLCLPLVGQNDLKDSAWVKILIYDFIYPLSLENPHLTLTCIKAKWLARIVEKNYWDYCCWIVVSSSVKTEVFQAL